MGRLKVIRTNSVNSNINAVLDVMKEAQDASPYSIEFDRDIWTEFVINAWRNPEDYSIYALVDNDEKIVGLISGGVYAASPMARSLRYALEMFWYVKPEYRGKGSIKLVEAYEKWSKDVGCTHCCMSLLNNEYKDSLHKFYTKRGYTPLETQYMRELS